MSTLISDKTGVFMYAVCVCVCVCVCVRVVRCGESASLAEIISKWHMTQGGDRNEYEEIIGSFCHCRTRPRGLCGSEKHI